MRDQFHQKVLCAIGALLFIHLPIRPSAALVYCRELIVFPPVYDAFRRYMLHVHLHLLPDVLRSLVWLWLPRFLLLPLRSLQLHCHVLVAPIAPRIPVSLRRQLVRLHDILPATLLHPSPYASQLLVRVLPWRAVRSSASTLQTLSRPIPPFQPFMHRLAG